MEGGAGWDASRPQRRRAASQKPDPRTSVPTHPGGPRQIARRPNSQPPAQGSGERGGARRGGARAYLSCRVGGRGAAHVRCVRGAPRPRLAMPGAVPRPGPAPARPPGRRERAHVRTRREERRAERRPTLSCFPRSDPAREREAGVAERRGGIVERISPRVALWRWGFPWEGGPSL